MKTSPAPFGNAKSTRRRVPRWAVLIMNYSQGTIFVANGTGSQIHEILLRIQALLVGLFVYYNRGTPLYSTLSSNVDAYREFGLYKLHFPQSPSNTIIKLVEVTLRPFILDIGSELCYSVLTSQRSPLSADHRMTTFLGLEKFHAQVFQTREAVLLFEDMPLALGNVLMGINQHVDLHGFQVLHLIAQVADPFPMHAHFLCDFAPTDDVVGNIAGQRKVKLQLACVLHDCGELEGFPVITIAVDDDEAGLLLCPFQIFIPELAANTGLILEFALEDEGFIVNTVPQFAREIEEIECARLLLLSTSRHDVLARVRFSPLPTHDVFRLVFCQATGQSVCPHPR
ncbi:hypothetical protein KC323_g236 [Hortaea werneckii]|nr:hypothetical protein KC323_g236 [Hortaea werneckii]